MTITLNQTAIDLICKEKGISPKIVASTATIRRAKEQCFALYNRDVARQTLICDKGLSQEKYLAIVDTIKR